MGDDLGLGFTILICMAGFGSCNACNDADLAVKNTKMISNQVLALDKRVDALTKVYVQDVTGKPIADEFYILNGDTAYVKIDGKKVNDLYK